LGGGNAFIDLFRHTNNAQNKNKTIKIKKTMHIKSKTHNSIVIFFLKTLHPGGIRTRTVSEADAMSTAQRRQGNTLLHLFLKLYR
jgi:hypothetical protein